MSSTAVALLVMIGVYAGFVFPFAYFRHDDWLMLGNALALAGDLGAAWKPTLLFEDGEHIWFFRPLFKSISLPVYRLFGLNYWAWLMTTLAAAVATLLLGERTLRRLGGEATAARWFVALYAAAVPLHFGSLVWIGEGLMNCPQGLLLMVSLWAMIRGLCGPGSERTGRSLAWQSTGVVAFVVALGFKESSVFHAFLVALLLWADARLSALPLMRRARILLPYAAIGGAYLIYRLGVLPFNPEYLPQWSLRTFLEPLGMITSALLLPLVVWGAVVRWLAPERFVPWARALATAWPYVAFVGICVLPYFGHHFFSPGWLYVPGLFTVWLACRAAGDQVPVKLLPATAMLLLVLSVVPVAARLNQLGWWEWHHGQKALPELLARLPKDGIERLTILDCPNETHPKAGFPRVVGHESSVYWAWKVLGGAEARVAVGGCPPVGEAITAAASGAVLKWRFPELTLVSSPGRDPSR